MREVALETATPRAGFIGTPEKVADELITWAESGAADGFVLSFQVISEGLDDFIEHVLPILEKRGHHTSAQLGKTLRDHLELPFKASRYATGEAAPARDEKAA